MKIEPQAKFYELIGAMKAYRGDYAGAIETFTAGIAAFPRDARLYRHRAHRYMNVRRLEEAQADFLKALEFLPEFTDAYESTQTQIVAQLEAILLNGAEPDAQPEVASLKREGQYYASLPFKIYYHLGLTQHILGLDEESAASLEEALKHSETVDLKVATLNWLVVVYGVLGNEKRIQELLADLRFDQAAEINAAYQELLKVYKGVMGVEELLEASKADARVLATSGYGLASLLLVRGEIAPAIELLERVVAEGDTYAFGTVAAEQKLKGIGAA